MEEHGTQTINIRPEINFFATRLFGSDIIWRTPDLLTLLLLLPNETGQTKINHLGFAIQAEEHIGWFDVSMHQAQFAGGVQALGHFQVYFQSPRFRQSPAIGDHHIQLPAIDQFHGDIGLAGKLAKGINLHHIAMIQGRRRLRFAPERSHEFFVIAQGPLHDLERDMPPQLAIDRVVNNPHTTGTQTIQKQERTKFSGNGLRRATGLAGDAREGGQMRNIHHMLAFNAGQFFNPDSPHYGCFLIGHAPSLPAPRPCAIRPQVSSIMLGSQ